MRSQLGFAAEGGVGLWQQQVGDIHGLAAIEIGIGEAAGVWSELHADIDGGAVEISCRRFCGDDAPLPFRADRFFGFATERQWVPAACDVAQRYLERISHDMSPLSSAGARAAVTAA